MAGISPSPSSPSNHHFNFCFYEFDIFLRFPNINEIIQCLSFSGLILFSIMPSSFHHVVADGRISFLVANISLCLYMYIYYWIVCLNRITVVSFMLRIFYHNFKKYTGMHVALYSMSLAHLSSLIFTMFSVVLFLLAMWPFLRSSET